MVNNKIIDSISELISENEIVAKWKDNTECMVSIICTSYNHERFICDAIDSFLVQDITYPFEIIIHDDASIDNTQDIIKGYAIKYPRIIKTILQTENQYSKGNKPLDICFLSAKGKYIAVCEGDDFWRDKTKLNKQIKFLEKNPDYVISCHNACIVDESNKELGASKLKEIHMRDFSAEELIKAKAYVLTLTWVFRNIKDYYMPEKKSVVNEDTFILSVLGLYGKAKYHNDIIPAAYRVHSGGVWSSADKSKRLTLKINTFYWLQIYHDRISSGWDGYFILLHLKYTLKRFILYRNKKSLVYYVFGHFLGKNK